VAIDWHAWSDEAFEEAQRLGRPVFLFVTAAWCRWCRELEQQVLADPSIQRLVEDRYVPIRVEKDRRPDIDARYSKGGWPTLAYLDEAGERIAANTWLDVGPLRSRLELIADHYAENKDEIRARLAQAADDEAAETRAAFARADVFPEPDLLDWVARTIKETADPEYGGWGSEHKFPHPEAIDFALVRWSQTGDEELRQTALRTLRQMEAGPIHDRLEGGFYRYATKPDWSQPHSEKMLDSNAQRLHAYLEAHQIFGDESFRTTAEGILRWLGTTLWDRELGAFRGSQDADPAYANLPTLEARREHGAPACDATIFANWNAMAASALFKASAVLEAPRWSERALTTLSFVLDELYSERHGVYHYWDGTYRLPGLLSDQAYTLRALLDSVQFASNNAALVPARRIADLAIEKLRSPSGAFYDRPYDPRATGGLRRRNRSLLENAVMAEALLRLSFFLHEPDYADCARVALAAFRDDYKRYGAFVAGYARAVDLLIHPPVQVTVVGPDEPATRALIAAALRPYVASRIVQHLEPTRDAELLARSGLPAPQPQLDRGPRAYVQRERESWAETSDPVKLPAVMTRIERAS